MRNFWKILAVSTTLLVLLSALFLTVAAENEGNGEGGNETDPTTSTQSTESIPSTLPTESTQSTEPTEPTGSTPSTEPTLPTDSSQTESTTLPTSSATTSTTTTTAATTRATRPTSTAAATTTTTTTTTEPTEETIIPAPTKRPPFGSPSRDTVKKPSTDSSNSTDDMPFLIGDVVLYTLIALVIMVGGGIAIYLITKTVQK